jgi:ribosomal protein S18 acetylase RimI-like enzyme
MVSGRAQIRPAAPGDAPGARYVCLKTGDHGGDGEPFYQDDPDALARIYVDPYLAFEPALALMLEDEGGICGYALAALDAVRFFARYDREWRPSLCERFPEPSGDPSRWSRAQRVHHEYHHPDYFVPEPADAYPSHLHIDLLPRVQGMGYGRTMMEHLSERLRGQGSPGVHLGMSALNTRAGRFYRKLGFQELARTGTGADTAVYLGRKLDHGGTDDG